MKNSFVAKTATRETHSSDEDEPVHLPMLDNSALVNRFRLTLIGRVFHTGGRSMEAFLALMPSSGIWDVEGRVRGFDLGNGRFHFNFDNEEELQKVLRKRPCHFSKWTFSLERWELDFQEDLLCNVTFWVRIRDLSLGCWVEEAFKGIGGAIGNVSEVDATEARVLVSVNVTKPLKFKKKVVLDSGETVMVSLTYERLYRYCFTCLLISHEERDCPYLSDHQRQVNKERRIAALPVEGRRLDGGRGEDGRRRGDLRPASVHRLSYNQLTGEILASLVHLSASENEIGGVIPAAYGALPKLEVLDLRENRISGCFPLWLTNLDSSYMERFINQVSPGIERDRVYVPPQWRYQRSSSLNAMSVRWGINLLPELTYDDFSVELSRGES